jgi:hypothetical protein
VEPAFRVEVSGSKVTGSSATTGRMNEFDVTKDEAFAMPTVGKQPGE